MIEEDQIHWDPYILTPKMNLLLSKTYTELKTQTHVFCDKYAHDTYFISGYFQA